MNVTVEEAKERLKLAQKEVLNVLTTLEKETGMVVTSISLNRVSQSLGATEYVVDQIVSIELTL